MNSNSKLKIGDHVQIISGKEKGKIGDITSINRKKQLIGLNSFQNIKRALQQSQNLKEKNNQLKEKEIPIFFHISNVMLRDKKTDQVSRIGIKYQDSKKIRIFKKSGNIVDNSI